MAARKPPEIEPKIERNKLVALIDTRIKDAEYRISSLQQAWEDGKAKGVEDWKKSRGQAWREAANRIIEALDTTGVVTLEDIRGQKVPHIAEQNIRTTHDVFGLLLPYTPLRDKVETRDMDHMLKELKSARAVIDALSDEHITQFALDRLGLDVSLRFLITGEYSKSSYRNY
jgi:hypothetical protein